MTRRSFVSGMAASAVGLLSGTSSAVPWSIRSSAEVTLRIGRVQVDVAPGKTITTTGYNGSAPAPLIRLREGVPVTVDIFNDTDVPEYVHWHGFSIPANIDGAEEEDSLIVPAHGHLRYSMTPQDPGSRWVHSHAMAMGDLTAGLYSGQFGFVYVEPKQNPGRYDQEIFLATHEWEPFFIDMDDDDSPTAVEEYGETDWGPSMVEVAYRVGSINGKALGHGEPIRVKAGQRVLFHILNASATENIELCLPGHSFLVIAMDGNTVPRPRRSECITLGAAERIDVIVEMNNPGVWILGSTDDDARGAGLGVLVEYAGKSEMAIAAKPSRTPWDYTLFGTEQEAPPPDETLPIAIARVPPDASGNEQWPINGKSYDPSDAPTVLSSGKRYRLIVDNQSADAHPLHLHRNTFEVTRVHGRSTRGVRKDVVLLDAFSKIEVDFVSDQRGPTLFHCHNQFHMERGFRKLFRVI
jgi:FtsP/CotA-like multicopper oxidase with cupredoxin domain